MEVKQIYSIVNSVVNQSLGGNMASVDQRGLVSIGTTVLSSTQNTELFLNSLVQRIGKTIISYRMYKSKFDDLIKDDFEWGAIVQKIKVKMPDAVEDPSYSLEDGKSVDQQTISKPKATQKLFVTETPYMFYVTISRELLKEAFTSEEKMGAFIQAIFGEVQNKIELALEELGRTCVRNYMLELLTENNSTRVINLLKLYNQENGVSLTKQKALTNADFLRFSTKVINEYSDYMTDMSTLYNDGTETRHTDKDYQKLYVLTDFERRLETISQYQAFHDGYVKLNNFKTVNYWQTPAYRDSIIGTPSSQTDAGSHIGAGIVACLFDTDALGIYKKDFWTANAPFNAKGGYTNTYWHMKELYFNDLSENFVMFTVDDDE